MMSARANGLNRIPRERTCESFKSFQAIAIVVGV